MNIDIIVKVIIPILGAILTYLIVPFIKSKTTKEQRENIYFWVKVAVGAAEQIYREKGEGKLKKEYVVAFLTSKGIDITMEELDVLIESAVKELNMIKDKTLE
ncbi:Bacteriophage holin of superfamily 6 (Holin_LLH) [Tissierella praeacuta DSM 18095]|uniref:Bacteriophage holin of superfamily 6 (Holin_LLH) n=1 Tax=Tissierella praeacuta DSM 18095 TaxID=1123404 RepID=A0A1M4Z2U8_9FIRM|nr:phage holin, LLH family [Tissierella praeacuta]SHF12117.1 Bacteriophage holin of superfamily 6 (Holin_LLH) [Tissierella praeacuta DSM 18095]SUP00618.1 phage holin, LL-H family [Tissierella praeacuta]